MLTNHPVSITLKVVKQKIKKNIKGKRMMEIIDLSQEIYAGMPVYPGLPQVKMKIHATHEEWDGEMGFTHYKNMINLHQLIGRGRFRFIGLPLKIRGGTGSPVRAIAVFE